MCLSKKTRPIPRLLNERTGDSHYHWTKKWGAGHPVPGGPLVCPRPFPALLPVSLTFTIGECSPAADAIMKPPRTYRTLHRGDLDPEAHVDLLLTRISCDLRVMYEPPDLSTPKTAVRTVVMLDRLLATIESHHRAIKALRNHLQEKGRRLTWPRKTRPTPRGRSARGRGTRPRCGAVRWCACRGAFT